MDLNGSNGSSIRVMSYVQEKKMKFPFFFPSSYSFLPCRLYKVTRMQLCRKRPLHTKIERDGLPLVWWTHAPWATFCAVS